MMKCVSNLTEYTGVGLETDPIRGVRINHKAFEVQIITRIHNQNIHTKLAINDNLLYLFPKNRNVSFCWISKE